MGHSQHGFRRGRSCLTTLISCCNSTTHLDDPGKPGDGICRLQQSASRTGWEGTWGSWVMGQQCLGARRDTSVLGTSGTAAREGLSCSEQAPQGIGTAQEHLDNPLRARRGFLGHPGQGQELDLIPVDPSTLSSWESIIT